MAEAPHWPTWWRPRGGFLPSNFVGGIELGRGPPVPVSRTAEHCSSAVRVEPRHDIDYVLRQFSFRRAGADEIADGFEREATAYQVVAGQVAHDQDPGALPDRRSRSVRDLDQPDLAALM